MEPKTKNAESVISSNNNNVLCCRCKIEYFLILGNDIMGTYCEFYTLEYGNYKRKVTLLERDLSRKELTKNNHSL